MRLFEWIITLSGLFLISCTAQPGDTSVHPSADMIGLLEAAAEASSSWRNPFMHDLRVAHYDSVMRFHPDIVEQQMGHYEKSLELLYAGKTEEAIRSFQELKEILPQYKRFLGSGYEEKMDMIESAIAVSYLRLGEQENCILNHTSASCIIPIAPAGQHQLKTGSEKAIEVYTDILHKRPEAYDAIWLMNIAYMTLGKYPEEVPPQWLIPPAAFESDYPLKRFEDIAPQLGLDVKALSGGSVVEDFNGDGYLDLLISSWGITDQMQYFQNNADGTFTERTAEAGLTGIVSGLNLVHTDYNNDGWADVLVLRGGWLNEHGLHPNSLLKNLGPGPDSIPRFIDVTREAGVLSFFPTQTATWNDFNKDGWVDLFIGNETNPYLTEQHYPAELYLNNQDGTFREVAQAAGIQLIAYVKGVTSGDYDNDGWPDLYVSTLEEPNYLFRNTGTDAQGIPIFEEVTEAAGIRENISTFPTWFWDYDNDGWLDIFVSGYNRGGSGSIAYDVAKEYLNLPFEADMPHLYRNRGDGTFEDVTRTAGLYTILHTMGSNFGDLDNDGYLDMYAGTGDPDFRSIVPNRMFRNAAGNFFQDVTTAGGFGNLQKGHAVSFADLDNDGDQDVYTVMGGANYGDIYQNLLFENPYSGTEAANNWLTLHLEGRQTNKMAIGTRVVVTLVEAGAERKIVRDVNSGGSFGCSPFRLELGLGKAAFADKIEIHWPVSKAIQTFHRVKAGQFLKIVEGDTALYSLQLEALHFPTGRQVAGEAAHTHH